MANEPNDTSASNSATPAVPAAAVAPTPAPVVAAESPAAPPPVPDADPKWLDARLAQATRSGTAKALEQLGVTDIDAAKAIIAQHAERLDAEKTATEKNTELESKLAATKTQADNDRAILTEQAARMVAALTDEQKAEVAGLSSENDPASQLKVIAALAPRWTREVAPPPAAPPAGNTLPGTKAPPESNVLPTDHAGIYANLQTSNPYAAATYLAANHRAIHPNLK